MRISDCSSDVCSSDLFQDVQLERDGDTLIVKLQERPAITNFKLEGNEKIGGDELKKSLKDLGLADGELFRRDLLDQVEQELRRQYYANGYYGVRSEEHPSELQSLMRISYAVFCVKKKKTTTTLTYI